MSLASPIFTLLVEKQESPSTNKGQCHWFDATEFFSGTLLGKGARPSELVFTVLVNCLRGSLEDSVDGANDYHLLGAHCVPNTVRNPLQELSG